MTGRPGTRSIRTGLYWLIGGGALTSGSHLLFQGTGGMLFYGVILVGGVQLLVGTSRRVAYELRTPEERERDTERDARATLVRAMVVMVNADGALEEADVQAIETVYERLVGHALDPYEVRRIAQQVGHGDRDPRQYFASLGTRLDRRMRALVATACGAVMTLGGNLPEERDRATLEVVLEGLGLPDDFFESRERA